MFGNRKVPAFGTPSNKTNGYEATLFTDPTNNNPLALSGCSRCAKCKLIPKVPMISRCGHTFCNQCMTDGGEDCERCFTEHSKKFVVIRSAAVPDFATMATMSRLTAKCKDCPWNGPFDSYETHPCKGSAVCECGVAVPEVISSVIATLLQEVEALQNRVTSMEGHQKSMECRLKIIGSQPETCHFNDWSLLDKKPVESLPFRKMGYKMKLIVYPKGNGMGCHDFMSVFICVMASEDDKNLQWPFSHKVKVEVIDKDDVHLPHSDEFRADPKSKSFQMP
ncbi:Hypothetical predicted protein [Mytilus galloprovincialis]|uniref:TNF receptor-associated factor n=1 Tax=Mytilus galloprovincialis TaxID=29158 RepID=A0A8B6FSH6_MYTGA|nr:Hypothetical predicted protein [Mytilus galloprovincialis]